MKSYSVFFFIILSLFFLFPVKRVFGVRFYLDIESKNISPYTFSISYNKATSITGKVVKKDLLLTPYFIYREKKGEIKITVEKTSKGIKLKASSDDEKIVEVTYKSLGQRFAGHSFSNMLLEALTGKSGPFGTLITFISDASGHDELVSSDIDGYASKTLTSYKSIMNSQKLSPSGLKVVLCTYFFNNPDLVLLDLKMGKQKVLTRNLAPEFSPAWSPDGKKIAFSASYDGDTDIYLMDLESEKIKKIIGGWGIDVSPSFSPDGKYLAFTSNRGGSPQIYLYNFETGSIDRLTFLGKYNASPVFSPDGTEIAFVTMRSDGWFDIARVNSDGTDYTVLTDGVGSNESPDWSPDSRFIIFSGKRREKDYDLYLLFPDTGDIKKLFDTPFNEKNPSWSKFYLNPNNK